MNYSMIEKFKSDYYLFADTIVINKGDTEKIIEHYEFPQKFGDDKYPWDKFEYSGRTFKKEFECLRPGRMMQT